jgi:hypothetical protein
MGAGVFRRVPRILRRRKIYPFTAAVIVSSVFSAAGTGAATLVGASLFAGVFSSAGAGAMSLTGASIFSGVFAASGHGSMLAVGTGVFNSVAAMNGAGLLNPALTGIHSRAVAIQGAGFLSGALYAFFLDAEKFIPDQELRSCKVSVEYRIASVAFDPTRHADVIVATIDPENRTAIVPFEDRVYQVGADPRRSDTPNRKRT